MNGCQIGVLTYEYAYLLKNGRECADNLFCKLSWLVASQPTFNAYIPVGTLISDPGQNACGNTNSVLLFAPIDPNLPTDFDAITFTYNGNPIILGEIYTSFSDLEDAVVDALTQASGVQWSYTPTSQWGALFCAPYTQNGDTVNLVVTVTQEFLLGNIEMNVTMSGGIAPEIPAKYQTESDNCITTTQYDQMVETSTWMTKNVKCCDKVHPIPAVDDCEDLSGDSNVELRETGNIEEREGGN